MIDSTVLLHELIALSARICDKPHYPI